MNAGMTREEFFGMAGLVNATEGAYTPVSLGKGNKVQRGNASWIQALSKANFHSAEELRNLTPENVTATDVVVNGDVISNYKAIVGDNTGKVYSIKTPKYQICQNAIMTRAIAQASEDTGIAVFGRMNDEGGRMGVNAFFADPDCNVDFGTRSKDPYMLGVRAYNSHTGETGFGAEIIGVRWICQNMTGFGQSLGKVSWKHFVKEENIVSLVSLMIEGYMDRVPVLKDRIEAMRNYEFTIDEAECALWGIKVGPFKAEGIMANLPELNPEVRHKNGKVSLYDTFNAVTAYNSWANTGGSESGRVRFMDRAETLITGDIERIIDEGRVARQNYLDSLKDGEAPMALIVD